MGIKAKTLRRFERKIRGEDRPEDCWFVETIEILIKEIRVLTKMAKLAGPAINDLEKDNKRLRDQRHECEGKDD